MSPTRKVRSGGTHRRGHHTRKCPKGKHRKIRGQRRGRRGRITHHGRLSKKCYHKRSRRAHHRRTHRRRHHRGGDGTTNYSNQMRPWTPQELALNAGF